MRLDRQETRAAPQSHKALRLKQIIPYDPFHSLFIRLRHIESSTAITTATKTIATPQTKALRNPICSKLIKSQPTIAKRAVDSRLIKKRRSDIFSRRFSIARLYLAKVNYLKELRDTLDTEALQEPQEFLAESMDRHADKSARDDDKKVDSNMDRHDFASAVSRDDRETRSATNLNTHKGGRILRLESGLCKVSAEISLDGYRTSEPKQSTILVQKTTPIILMALLLSACTTTKEAVYIPTKCKTKDIPKPMPSKESSVSEDVAEILKYTELLERDLEFCKGDGQ